MSGRNLSGSTGLRARRRAGVGYRRGYLYARGWRPTVRGTMGNKQTAPGSRPPPAAPPSAGDLSGRYRAVRALTERLREPLSAEDCQVQSMDDASPTKWHLAHTSWFFETFVLTPPSPDYRPFHPEFGVLFNSYYQQVGPQYPRPRRGLLTRPSLDEVLAYRAYVDQHLLELLARANGRTEPLAAVIELGLNHEQQHQELILTDVKHLLSANSLRPAYRTDLTAARGSAPPRRWSSHPGGRCQIGHAGRAFAFDNERPRHDTILTPFALANRLVTNAEFLAFIEDGGYQQPGLWLSDGWNTVQARGWSAPLYWERRDGECWQFTLAGMRPLASAEPVSHVSFYEADAYATWAGARLPTEAEWEAIAATAPVSGNLL